MLLVKEGRRKDKIDRKCEMILIRERAENVGGKWRRFARR